MTTIENDNLIGFFASFGFDDNDQEVVKDLLWGEQGLKKRLEPVKWYQYGKDFHLILFQFYVKPIPYLRDQLREIEDYRRKEKSIGIPVIIDETNFFDLSLGDRQTFLKRIILEKLNLLKEKVKRNKLDLDLKRLTTDTEKLL